MGVVLWVLVGRWNFLGLFFSSCSRWHFDLVEKIARMKLVVELAVLLFDVDVDVDSFDFAPEADEHSSGCDSRTRLSDCVQQVQKRDGNQEVQWSPRFAMHYLPAVARGLVTYLWSVKMAARASRRVSRCRRSFLGM